MTRYSVSVQQLSLGYAFITLQHGKSPQSSVQMGIFSPSSVRSLLSAFRSIGYRVVFEWCTGERVLSTIYSSVHYHISMGVAHCSPVGGYAPHPTGGQAGEQLPTPRDGAIGVAKC